MLSADEVNFSAYPGLGLTLLSTPGLPTSSGVLLDHSVAGTLKVRNFGNSADAIISGGTYAVLANTALSSVTAVVMTIGSASSFGIYAGSGAPSLAAAIGSVYLRTDGSSTTTRMYVASTSAGG